MKKKPATAAVVAAKEGEKGGGDGGLVRLIETAFRSSVSAAAAAGRDRGGGREKQHFSIVSMAKGEVEEEERSESKRLFHDLNRTGKWKTGAKTKSKMLLSSNQDCLTASEVGVSAGHKKDPGQSDGSNFT